MHVCSVMADSVTLWTIATRLLCPWDSPGMNTGVGCYFLLQGIFPIQGSNPCLLCLLQGLPRRLSSKEPACQCRRLGFNPWVGEMPWRRKGQSTPVLLSGESIGQRSLAGYSPWGRKELDMTKATEHAETELKMWIYHVLYP